MSTVTERVRTRVEPSPLTAGLLAGDTLAIGLFVVIGEISHGIDPLANVPLVLDTFAPFYIGWLLVALPAGLYGSGALSSPKRAGLLTLGAWAVADVIGQALRATAYFHGNAALTFALVALAFGGLFLVGWRVGFTLVLQRRGTGR